MPLSCMFPRVVVGSCFAFPDHLSAFSVDAFNNTKDGGVLIVSFGDEAAAQCNWGPSGSAEYDVDESGRNWFGFPGLASFWDLAISGWGKEAGE